MCFNLFMQVILFVKYTHYILQEFMKSMFSAIQLPNILDHNPCPNNYTSSNGLMTFRMLFVLTCV